MSIRQQYPIGIDALRKRAEQRLRENSVQCTPRAPTVDADHMYQDLMLHQIELEMQNHELRQTHVELENMRDQYADLYEFAPVGYITISNTGIILKANLSGSSLLQTSRLKLIGQPLSCYVHPDAHTTYYRHRSEAEHATGVTACEVKMITADWRVFFAQISTVRTLDDDGDTVTFRTAITDVTAIHDAYEAVKESRRRTRMIVEIAADGILTVGSSGHIESANEAAVRIFRRPAQAIVGRDCQTLLSKTSRHAYRDFIESHQLTNNDHVVSGQLDTTGVRGDGDTFPMSLAIGATGVDSRLETWIIRDLTQEHMLQRERAELETQLHQGEKMKTIGTMAAGIAHEFNNILTPMIGFADMALDDIPPGERTHRYVRLVVKAGERARDLVQQLLTVSRQKEISRQSVAIAPIVREAMELLEIASPSSTSFHLHVDNDCGCVYADAGQIHEVVMILVANANQAMPSSGGVIDVTLRKYNIGESSPNRKLVPEAGDYVRLSVADNGCGIDDAVINRIFEPFYTTKGVGEGTGLGLYVAFNIAAGSGGAITAASDSGGATFHVYWPVGGAATSLSDTGNAGADDVPIFA